MPAQFVRVAACCPRGARCDNIVPPMKTPEAFKNCLLSTGCPILKVPRLSFRAQRGVCFFCSSPQKQILNALGMTWWGPFHQPGKLLVRPVPHPGLPVPAPRFLAQQDIQTQGAQSKRSGQSAYTEALPRESSLHATLVILRSSPQRPTNNRLFTASKADA